MAQSKEDQYMKGESKDSMADVSAVQCRVSGTCSSHSVSLTCRASLLFVTLMLLAVKYVEAHRILSNLDY